MKASTRNSEVLDDFVAYCKANPDLRFWQALASWSGNNYIVASSVLPCYAGFNIGVWRDTFYWEGKAGKQ